MTNKTAQTIAELNDRFRSVGPSSGIPGRGFMTVGVAALPAGMQLLVWGEVAGFTDFTEDKRSPR